MKRYWPDVAIVVILAVLPGLFFWRLLTPNPTDRMQIVSGDFDEQYFPLRAFAAQEWVNGRVPLWNPYIYGGQPALADIQSGALYPIHVGQAVGLAWGAAWFGSEVGFPLQALEWQMIIHFSIASIGTYLFFRYETRRHGVSLRLARFGGLMAALIFSYSGYLTGFPVQQVTILEASAWLPWVMWGLSAALWRANDTPVGGGARTVLFKLWPAAWAALAFALAILAGHPQTVLYIFYLTAVYTGFRAWYYRRGRTGVPWSRCTAASVAVWLAIVLLGAAIAAAQLLPTFEFIARSVRSDLSFQAVSAGLPLIELVSILYPGFFGGSPEYVGIASLVLIALALVLARPRPFVYFWAGVGLVSLLVAFGRNLFAYPVFYLLAPGFDTVRQQERIFLVFSFAAAVLAGYGAIVLAGPLPKLARQTYARFERSIRVVWLIAFAVTAIFIYSATVASARAEEVNLFFGVLRQHLFGLIFLGGMLVLMATRPRRWLSRWWGMALLAAWVALNLFTVNWRFNLEDPSEPARFSPNTAVRFLQQQLGNSAGRVASGGLLPGGNSAASVYNLEDLTGNSPLQLAAVATLFDQMPAWRLWQLANVRYIVEDRAVSDPGLRPVLKDGELNLFEMGDPLARARFVAGVETIGDVSETLTRLADDQFDLKRQAILTEPLDISSAGRGTSTITITDLAPAILAAELDTTDEQLLVIGQTFYPGWRAHLDGQPVELHRANLVQQAVVVPAGPHSIRLTYWPASFSRGLIISAAALLLVAAVLVLGRA